MILLILYINLLNLYVYFWEMLSLKESIYVRFAPLKHLQYKLLGVLSWFIERSTQKTYQTISQQYTKWGSDYNLKVGEQKKIHQSNHDEPDHRYVPSGIIKTCSFSPHGDGVCV